MKWEELDEFTQQYIETALWASYEEDGTPLDENYGWFDLADETILAFYNDCQKFQTENQELIDMEENQDNSTAGHDFWLTRNGHGVGFWDGDWPISGDKLTIASEKFGEVYLYVGDDGKLYC